jgi:hypothetical protein
VVDRVKKGEGGVTKVTPKKGWQRVRDWQSAFLKHLCERGNVSCASKAARISRKTVYARLDMDPLFKAAWEDALDEACDHMEEEARWQGPRSRSSTEVRSLDTFASTATSC